MSLIDLHKKCCEKESMTINEKEIKSSSSGEIAESETYHL